MRVKTPQPFNENEDYPIGRRLTYDGHILIVEPYSHKQEVISMEMRLGNRCTICGVRDICKMQIKCRKHERKDRKQVYFRIKKFSPKGTVKSNFDLMIKNNPIF